MSKVLAKLAAVNPSLIEKYWNEGSDGYWVALRKGWICTWSGTHCIHEGTVKDVLAAFKDIAPCNCTECSGETI